MLQGHHTLIEKIRCDEGIFMVIQLDKSDATIRIDRGLLKDATDSFEFTDGKVFWEPTKSSESYLTAGKRIAAMFI